MPNSAVLRAEPITMRVKRQPARSVALTNAATTAARLRCFRLRERFKTDWPQRTQRSQRETGSTLSAMCSLSSLRQNSVSFPSTHQEQSSQPKPKFYPLLYFFQLGRSQDSAAADEFDCRDGVYALRVEAAFIQ